MASLTLTLAGTTYGGLPAGAGTNNFEADDNGTDADRVYYRYFEKKRGLIWDSTQLKVGVAYLDPSERASVESLGIVAYKTQEEAERTHLATYYLWRYDEKARKIG